MSQQIQITGGAKVRDLQDVIIGTSGVLSSVAFNVANGVPKLDVNGKILVSQLPNSVMEYKGVWNAATNSPTLTNGGAFNQGDVYLCDTAGTVNFGSGSPISFIVGDQAIYSGSVWQKAGGATGTVTSVGLSTNAGAITIGSSPITTSGTITANFNGTNLQYVNGAGNLTTFPTLITSIGLSMPSAFSVANSPLTANGTIAVTGAGVASQYIRGDGTLADFPSSGGGGSSVSYYLNGGTSQGTIGGTTYYEMSKTAVVGTGVDFAKSGDGFIVAFLTDANDPAQLNIPAGNWNYEIYASMSSNGGTPQMYAELYVYDGTTFTLISTSSNEIIYDGTALNLYTFAMAVPATTLALTDRLAIKLYATNSGGKTTTVHTQDSHLCQVITTFSTGITALNGLTAQVQYFATGTSGSDFNISSTTATHTFNIPDASATARGLITTGTQTIAGTKTFNDATKNNGGIFLQNASSNSLAGYMNLGGLTNGVKFTSGGGISNSFTLPSATGYTFTFPNATGTIALTSDLTGYLTAVTATSPLSSSGGTTPNITISQATTSTNGYLSSTDWNTFNLKQPQLNGTGFVKATGTTISYDNSNYVTSAYFSATNPLIYSLGNFSIDKATTTDDGYLSKFDFNTFNNKQATITLTTTGTSGAATFSSNTLNIPNYAPDLSGYVTLATTQTISGAKTFSLDLIVNSLKIGQGNNSLGYNVAFGVDALLVTTTGNFNIAIGHSVLKANTTGQLNTGIGSECLYSNTTGTQNVAVGEGASKFNTTGSYNTAIGSGTLAFNTAGSNNTAIGFGAMNQPATGSNNTAVGYLALGYSTGSNNIGIGYSSGINITTGTYNHIFGLNVGLTTGSYNTIIGYLSGSSISTGSYNTIIGNANALGDVSNNIALADGQGNMKYHWDGTNNNFYGSAVFSSSVTATGGFFNGNGSFTNNGFWGTLITAGTGTYSDFAIIDNTSTQIMRVPTGTRDVVFSSSVTANGLYANAGNSARFYRSANDYYWQINSDSSNYLNFGTYLANGTAYGTNPKVVLFDSGNVGIGTAASDSGYKLDCNGTGRFSGNVNVLNSASDADLKVETTLANAGARLRLKTSTTEWYIYTNQTSSTLRFFNGDDRFVLTNTGAATFSSSVTVSGKVFLNTTTAYTSELNVQAIAANRPAIKAGYGGVTGNGYWLLGDNYTTDESLMAIGIDYSSGGLVLGSALAPSTTTSGAFISTQAQFGGYGSAIRLGTSGDIIFYNGTQNSTIAAGSAKTASVALTIAQTGAATFSNLAGTGSRAVLADANGLLSAPVSDISVKQNIKPIGYGLNEIVKMNPVWFDFIDGYKNFGEGRQNGNIAQEMEAIIPEAVFTTPSTGKMGINYDQLHAVYIKAIQELKSEIEQLKLKIK